MKDDSDASSSCVTYLPRARPAGLPQEVHRQGAARAQSPPTTPLRLRPKETRQAQWSGRTAAAAACSCHRTGQPFSCLELLKLQESNAPEAAMPAVTSPLHAYPHSCY